MVDSNLPLRETAAGEAVNIELAKQEKIYRESLKTIAADCEEQTKEMRSSIQELEDKLQKVEEDRAMMMSQRERLLKAAKAGKTKEFRQLAREMEEMETEFQKKKKDAEKEKDPVKREIALLTVIGENEKNKKKHQERERGFWKTVFSFLAAVAALGTSIASVVLMLQ